MPTVSEMLAERSTSISTRDQRISDGSMVLVCEGMAEEEKALHVKYGVPATVDLSRESLERAIAEREAARDARVAAISSRQDVQGWLAKLGLSRPRISPSSADAPPEVIIQARAMCDDLEHHGGGLFIHGLPGRGKTAIAENILRHWELDGRRGDRVAERQYLDAIKASFDGHADEYEVKRRYGEPPLLVFDDLGAAKESEWALAEIEWLVDWRWTNGLSTIITSNYDMPGLRSKWSKVDPVQADRIISRINGMCVDVHLTGPDHRPSVRVVNP